MLVVKLKWMGSSRKQLTAGVSPGEFVEGWVGINYAVEPEFWYRIWFSSEQLINLVSFKRIPQFLFLKVSLSLDNNL
jgi:hypothetical protein